MLSTRYIRTYIHIVYIIHTVRSVQTLHTVQYILYILYIPYDLYRTVPYCVRLHMIYTSIYICTYIYVSSPPCSLDPQRITARAGETSRLATSPGNVGYFFWHPKDLEVVPHPDTFWHPKDLEVVPHPDIIYIYIYILIYIYTPIKKPKIESLNSCSLQAARIQSSILISTPAVALYRRRALYKKTEIKWANQKAHLIS